MPYFMYNHQPGFVFVLILLVIWTLVWKGLALWESARRGDKNWFIAILIINTVGILDILYLYVFSKDKVNTAPVAQDKIN